MLNTWYFNLIIYLILYVIFTQMYKKATAKCSNDGALTVLLQFISGIFVLIFIPFFNISFSNNIITYVLFFIAIVLYALADRVNTTARRGLEVSVYSVLGQLSTAFVVAWGIIFFKEEILINKLIGASLILFGNIFVLYRVGRVKFDKYVLFSLLGNLATSVAICIDVGISEKFNLAMYVSITFILSSILILRLEKIKIKDVISQYINGNRKSIICVGLIWGIMIIQMLRAYQYGSVATIAPLCSLTAILNVFVAYFIFKEKDSVLKKILSTIILLVGVVLINL